MSDSWLVVICNDTAFCFHSFWLQSVNHANWFSFWRQFVRLYWQYTITMIRCVYFWFLSQSAGSGISICARYLSRVCDWSSFCVSVLWLSFHTVFSRLMMCLFLYSIFVFYALWLVLGLSLFAWNLCHSHCSRLLLLRWLAYFPDNLESWVNDR